MERMRLISRKHITELKVQGRISEFCILYMNK